MPAPLTYSPCTGLRSVICDLPICPFPPFAIRYSPFAIRHSPFAIRSFPSFADQLALLVQIGAVMRIRNVRGHEVVQVGDTATLLEQRPDAL
jgi:hypothetical protein